jgi:aminobenzoyl-glutamate utilization protein B
MKNILDTPEKKSFLDFVDRNREGLATLSDAIFYFGELGMQEYRTSELMSSLLEEHGFDVNLGVCGFPTGFVATYGSGSPVIAIHCEYDGNPTNSQQSGVTEKLEIVDGAPGHCEGHNANGAVMVVTAIGLRYAMERFGLPGTLKIVGSPAEETLIARPYFVRDGVFDDVDVAFHDHISAEFKSDYGHIQYAAISADFVFNGESSHASYSPHNARDALDAVVLMDMGIAQYREHFEPHMSAQRVITHGGHQPNIIPAMASVWWYFRAPFADGAARLFEQGKKIAQGAALMTKCEVDVRIRSAVWPVHLNETAAKVLQEHIDAVGMPDWTEEEQEFAKTVQRKLNKPPKGMPTSPAKGLKLTQPIAASNDSGDVSWKVPMARVLFPGCVPGTIPHHWAGGVSLATSLTHKGAMVAAKSLGSAILEYMTDKGDLVARTKATFKAETNGIAYKSLLPDGQKPPVNLNREEMEKFRGLMEPHYIKERPKIVA